MNTEIKEQSGGCCKGCKPQRPQTSENRTEETKNREEVETIEVHVHQPSLRENPQKLVFKIDGMCCGKEVEKIKNELNPLIGTRDIILSFNLTNKKLILEGQNDMLSNDEITNSVAKAKPGMKAT